MESKENTIQKLNELNYGRIEVPYAEKPDFAGQLETYDASTEIETDVKKMKDVLEKQGLYLGVISVGAHSADYFKIYGITKENDWNKTPVMFVFECPGDNKSSCLNKAEEDQAGVDWHGHMSDSVWHADRGDASAGKKYFGKQRVYTDLMLAIIKTFKLSNFYTTNYFRYEIYEKNNGKEIALNLNTITKKIGEIVDDTIFWKEYETFKPKVIFATSEPYWHIVSKLSDTEQNEEVIVVKVPHPASARSGLNEDFRYLINTMQIATGLLKGGVISNEAFDGYIKELTAFYAQEGGEKTITVFPQKGTKSSND